MPSNYGNFNFSRPRCAETLPRVPPFSSIHDALAYPHVSYGTSNTLDAKQLLRAQCSDVSTNGTYFGVVGRTSQFPEPSRVPTAVAKRHTLGYGNRSTAHRNSMGHLLDKGGNVFDDFFGLSATQRANSRSTQYIIGRQTSARPNHVCYSLQCPCQPAATHRPDPLSSDNFVPVSAYYPAAAPATNLEKYRRPVESPKLNDSQNSLNNGNNLNQDNRGMSTTQDFLNYHPTTTGYGSVQPAAVSGQSSIHYFDLSETSSEASTRIASRMSSDHNVTQSTENDTHHLTKGPYSITKVPIKKDSVYVSSTKSSPPSRLTPARAVLYSSALIAMLTALCVVLLIASQWIPSMQEQSLRSPIQFSPVLDDGSLTVVPAPTDLMDRSQVIIVNRHNSVTYQQQAQHLSELLSVISAYNATQTDAAFPTQLISSDCSPSDNFGYKSGDPCIAVVFRPNPNFIPIGTKDGLLELECLCENRYVRIGYSPYRGFPLRFFPRGQNASPLVAMLKFTDLPFKTELRISCGLVGASNVDARRARVSFQIMVI